MQFVKKLLTSNCCRNLKYPKDKLRKISERSLYEKILRILDSHSIEKRNFMYGVMLFCFNNFFFNQIRVFEKK